MLDIEQPIGQGSLCLNKSAQLSKSIFSGAKAKVQPGAQGDLQEGAEEEAGFQEREEVHHRVHRAVLLGYRRFSRSSVFNALTF